MYQKIIVDGNVVGVFHEGIGCIPVDEANRDYADFLEWLAEGNEPEVITT